MPESTPPSELPPSEGGAGGTLLSLPQAAPANTSASASQRVAFTRRQYDNRSFFCPAIAAGRKRLDFHAGELATQLLRAGRPQREAAAMAETNLLASSSIAR